MKKNLVAIIVASVALAAPALASSVELTDVNKAKIVEMLTADGYEVGKIKIEDGQYEAYAKKDGHKLEIFLNGDFEIVKTEQD